MDHHRDAGSATSVDDRHAGIPARRQRLLHNQGQPRFHREFHQGCVRSHRRGDIDEIELFAPQHLFGALIGRPGAEFLDRREGLALIEVARRRERYVFHAGPRRQMVLGEESAADDAHAKRCICH
jgi:hypothetical protein